MNYGFIYENKYPDERGYDLRTICMCAVHHWKDCEMVAEIDGLEVHNLIVSHKSWDAWATSPNHGLVTLGGYHISKVDSKVEEDPDVARYGEGRQGFEGAAYVVFRVTNGPDAPKFYRKEGTVDSYSNINWGGQFRPVAAKVKEVTVYEYE